MSQNQNPYTFTMPSSGKNITVNFRPSTSSQVIIPSFALFVCSKTPLPEPYTGTKEPVYSFEYEGKTYYTLYQAGVPVSLIGNPSYAMPNWQDLLPGYWAGEPTNETLGELAEPCS